MIYSRVAHQRIFGIIPICFQSEDCPVLVNINVDGPPTICRNSLGHPSGHSHMVLHSFVKSLSRTTL